MKAISRHSHRVLRAVSLLFVAISLSHCALPPQQAWRYIQSNGLLTYMRYEAGAATPPFGAGTSQRYASSRVPVSRYRPVPQYSSVSRQSYGPAYSSSGYAQNRYYSQSTRAEAPRPRSAPAPVKPRSSQESSPPRVKIPIEEPEPRLANDEPPRSSPTPGISASSFDSPATPKPVPANELPFGTAVPGRVNMVNSPFAGKTQLVDVSGMSAGQTVKCPYTGKLFKVPSSQQAQNKAESPASETDGANP